jgi:beta-fructofuranosidase
MDDRMNKSISHFGMACLVLAQWVAICTPSESQEVEIDRYLVEVVRDHVNNIVHYRDKLLREPHRPTYHFVVPEGIAEPFDPNGALYWNGRYHLFYIFQERPPRDNYRGDSWGHVSSHDLVHWRWHPTTLEPSGDEVGMYSGNVFLDKNGAPTIAYQGLGAGNCIATSTDSDLNVWEKSPHNPVIPYPEVAVDDGQLPFREILSELPEYGKYDAWDPHVWLEGDTYYMICGDSDGWPSEKSTLFKSADLIDWEFSGDFMNHDLPEIADYMKKANDCPDFFKLGDKYVFILLGGGARYYIGEWKNEQFYPEHHQRLPGSLAPESMVDEQGRRISWAWVPGHFGRRDERILSPGWSGTMSLPRVLTLGDGVLHIEPVEELESLRHSPVQLKDLTVAADSAMKISQVSGDTLELQFTIDPGDADKCGIKVRCSPDGEEETLVVYDTGKKVIRADATKSTLDEKYKRGWTTELEEPFELKPGELLNLRIFLDRSIMEVYVNKRLCVTQRIYPSREDSQGLVLFAEGGDIEISEFNAWKMHPSNPW